MQATWADIAHGEQTGFSLLALCAKTSISLFVNVTHSALPLSLECSGLAREFFLQPLAFKKLTSVCGSEMNV